MREPLGETDNRNSQFYQKREKSGGCLGNWETSGKNRKAEEWFVKYDFRCVECEIMADGKFHQDPWKYLLVISHIFPSDSYVGQGNILRIQSLTTDALRNGPFPTPCDHI